MQSTFTYHTEAQHHRSKDSLPRCIAMAMAGTLFLLGIVVAPPTLARQTPVNLTSRQQGVQISMMALYQNYEEDGLSVDQISFPLSIVAPLGPSMNLTVSARHATASGDSLESLAGLSDTQVSLGYARSIGNSSLIFSLGLNLPSGKRELSSDEFQTLVLISQTAFDFRVPSLGQGFGASPAVTLALPVSSDLVLGLGASYRVRGGFKPIEGMEIDYTPGNELLLTTGLDSRLGQDTSLSIDATYTRYAADQLGDDEIFDAGSKITITTLIRHVRGFNEWRMLGLYRARAKTSRLGGGALATSAIQTIANELLLQVSYRMRINTRLRATILAESHFFDETPVYQARKVFDIGVLPTYRLSHETTLVTRFIFTTGTISGIEAGAGLAVQL